MFFRRVIISGVVVVAIGLCGVAAAWRPAISPIPAPPPSSFSDGLVADGALLASAGYCSSCHTGPGGKPYAGGYAIPTQFETIYSTNITPDPVTGIGHWSQRAFSRAMRQGVARNGTQLLPAFPYNHFTKLSDHDIAALYAFLMTRKPVVAPAREDGWLLRMRFLQAGWKLLFFRPGRYKPDPTHDMVWNRGAYLAQGISHCGACHTPRNLLGAEEIGRRFAGAAIDSWVAPPLTAQNPSPVAWSKAELEAYLGSSVSRYHGTSAGPMAPAVDGLKKLPKSDIAAIATYFADVDGSAARTAKTNGAVAAALANAGIGTGHTYAPAARLYAEACASCHYNSGKINPLRPDLALNSALNLHDPTDLIQVMLHGINSPDGAPGIVMPAFNGFSNADIAQIAAYLRATRTGKPAWPHMEETVTRIRAEGQG